MSLPVFIATLGPLGYVRRLPGTVGSAVGLGIAWLLSPSPAAQAAACAAVIALGVWSSGRASVSLGLKDPPMVIIDEVAGMMLSVALLPATKWVYLAGFLLFRFFDIFKPWPIRRLEQLPGSWGIMADDLLAGLLANGLLRLAF